MENLRSLLHSNYSAVLSTLLASLLNDNAYQDMRFFCTQPGAAFVAIEFKNFNFNKFTRENDFSVICSDWCDCIMAYCALIT